MRAGVSSSASRRRARYSGVGRHSLYASRTASGTSTSGSGLTSWRISAIGKMALRSSGPAGAIVPGCSGGSGSPGRSGRRLTQCVGIASSLSRNFVWSSAMAGQPYPPPMATRGVDHGPSVEQAVSLYAAGYFPMDDVTEAHNPLPFYAAERRAVLELDEASRSALRRHVRRSLRTGASEGWQLVRDERFEEVLEECARPREPGDGVWITERLQGLYRRLHEAGLAHSFEIEADGEL